MQDFFKLKNIDAQLTESSSRFSFLAMNPTNIGDELSKVAEDENYNPVFEYREIPYDVEKTIQKLESIDEHDSYLGGILNRAREQAIHKNKMLLARGTADFTNLSLKVYGAPDRELVEQAKKCIAPMESGQVKTVSSKAAVNKIKAEILHYGFEYVVDDVAMSSSAAVQASQRQILVRKDCMFSEQYVRRLIVHEVGTHVLRAENGRLQHFNIFVTGFPDYLATEEGLAVYNEERFGVMGTNTFSRFAARTIAVDKAMGHSFSSIYKMLQDHFSPAIAGRITLRAKRGLEDTSKSGGLTKDYVYLHGYQMVKDFVKNGGSIRKLYYGKIGLEHVPHMNEIPGIVQPLFLPQKQFFKDLLKF